MLSVDVHDQISCLSRLAEFLLKLLVDVMLDLLL